MNLRSARIETSPKLMIIPMIDIIFFLLVFFMMGTLQMVHQKTMPVQLPTAQSGGRNAGTVSVTISQAGQLYLDDQAMPLAELQRAIGLRKKQEPEMTVVLRADRDAIHGTIVEVMDGLKEAGIEKLAIAAVEKGR